MGLFVIQGKKTQNNRRSAFLEKSVFLCMVSGGSFLDLLRWKLTYRSIPRYCGPEEIHDRASFDCSYLGNKMAGSVQKSIDT